MEILYVALKSTFPLLFTMSIGYSAKRSGIFGKSDIAAINKLVYWILLPILLFKSVYQPQLYTLQNSKILIFSVLATFCIILCAFIGVPLVIKDTRKIGVIIQSLIRGNVLYFGIPVISTLLGDDKVGLISIVIVALVPIYNVVSVFALSKYTDEQAALKEVVKKLLSNPLIISAVVGILCVILGIELPELIMQPLINVSKATTPIALILLGAAIEFTFTRDRLKMIFTTIAIKLIFVPVLVVATAVYLRFSSDEIVTIFAVFAAPTAVASYSLAREMKGDYDLAGQLVFLSTVMSVITIFIGTVILQWIHIL